VVTDSGDNIEAYQHMNDEMYDSIKQIIDKPANFINQALIDECFQDKENIVHVTVMGMKLGKVNDQDIGFYFIDYKRQLMFARFFYNPVNMADSVLVDFNVNDEDGNDGLKTQCLCNLLEIAPLQFINPDYIMQVFDISHIELLSWLDFVKINIDSENYH
jgi:hypothetical protein